MTTFLFTLGWGFLALLGAAILVAAWEHASAKSRARLPPPPSGARRVAQLDLNLDQLSEPALGDKAQRQATLGGALGRMATPPAGVAHNPEQAWIETEPMVAESLQVELPADSTRA